MPKQIKTNGCSSRKACYESGYRNMGIVESVEGEVVHTMEGNTTNSVARRSYRPDSNNICGYGTPLY